MIDGLFDLLFMACRPVISISAIFRTRTSSIVYKNYINMKERMCQPEAKTFDCHVRIGRVGTLNFFFFLAAIMRLLFFEICLKRLWPTGSVTLSKHVFQDGSRSGSQGYNMTTPHWEDPPPLLSSTNRRVKRLC